MEPEELQKKIDILQRQVDTMSTPSGFQLKYPLDPESQKIIKDLVSQEIMDIVWNNYFYYFTGFSSAEEFSQSGASVVFDGGGVLLTTAASSNTSTYIFRDLSILESIDFSKTSRFRARIRLGGTITNYHLEIGIGSVSAPNIDDDGYGFYIEDDTLFGFAQSDFSSRSTVQLKTVSAGDTISLDARYYPNGKVEFYVNNKQLGSIASNLPTGIDSSVQFLSFVVTTQNGTAKSAYAHAFEFMQDRII